MPVTVVDPRQLERTRRDADAFSRLVDPVAMTRTSRILARAMRAYQPFDLFSYHGPTPIFDFPHVMNATAGFGALTGFGPSSSARTIPNVARILSESTMKGFGPRSVAASLSMRARGLYWLEGDSLSHATKIAETVSRDANFARSMSDSNQRLIAQSRALGDAWFASATARDVFAAVSGAAGLIAETRRLWAFDGFAAVGLHRVLREELFGPESDGPEWDEIYGVALAQFVASLRQTRTPREAQLQAAFATVALETILAAKAFADGDVELGVIHAVSAGIALRVFLSLRQT